MSISVESLTLRVKGEAARLGFEAVAIARADLPLDVDFARYEEFLGRGYHGEMAYLEADREVRRSLDGEGMLPGARSVVCVARSYKRADAAEDPGIAQLVAKYARGQDYHNVVRKKLRRLAAFVRTLGEGVAARPLLDDAPVLERAWAARAGLGFVGKNGLLIVPGQGSFVLLGEVVTTLSLVPDGPIAGRCGSCTACLDACPTAAFPEPFVLDARRCVAYLTIEAREVAPEPLREGIGERVFGCDTCQDVCPFNAGRGSAGDPRPFTPHARLAELSLEALASLDTAAFDALREGSPMGRPGRNGLRRNAAIALGNRVDQGEGTRALLEGLRGDTSPPVREAAEWALGRRRRA